MSSDSWTRVPPGVALLSLIEETSEILRAQLGQTSNARVTSEPFASLLEQCEAATRAAKRPPPLRTIHHFACTGGTVICKELAALPNTVMLSEMDPLSMRMLPTDGPLLFTPRDLISALRGNIRPISDEIIVSVFLAGLAEAKTRLERLGYQLLLRDHPHSQFCSEGIDHTARPTPREMLEARFDLRSVVTIRHPLDSFLGLQANGWRHFQPFTLDEYARRYLAFLHRHAGLPVVLYEDFTTDPDAILQRLCGLLELEFSPLAKDLIGLIRMSGDSGRKAESISTRQRRDIPPEVGRQRDTSADYATLCQRLGYEI